MQHNDRSNETDAQPRPALHRPANRRTTAGRAQTDEADRLNENDETAVSY